MESKTLDILLEWVKEEYKEDKPYTEQTPQFYDVLDRYQRAKAVYDIEEFKILYGRTKNGGAE